MKTMTLTSKVSLSALISGSLLLPLSGCVTPRPTGAQLVAAVTDGNIERVRTLLDHGADVEADDGYGRKPLNVASRQGQTDIVRLLLDHGAKVNERRSSTGDSGPPPLCDATSAGHVEVVRLLLDRGAQIRGESVCGNINTEVMSLLLDRGLNANQRDAFGSTLLMEASRSGNLEVAKVLLNRGADVNLKDSQAGIGGGWTPLHAAAAAGHLDVAALLLERGANVKAKNNGARTPLHLAVYYGKVRVVALLLEHGADPLESDREAKTPLMVAQEGGNTTLIRILQQAEAAYLAGVKSPAVGIEGVTPPSRPTGSLSDVDRLPPAKAVMRPHVYAVVIGIEQYREKLPKADFADRDARLMGDYLVKVLGYPEENVVVRLNEKAAKTDLEKYFEEWLRNNVEKDGSVFVYYSGHGAPNPRTGDAYLVPYDGDPNFVDSTGFPLKRLYAALDKLPAKDITVVLDSCFSGAGGRSVLAKGSRPMVISVENPVLAAGKVVVLAASSGSQISNTYLEQGHGLLTYFLLKGLQGEGDLDKDGAIELAELFEYVKPNVQRVARRQYNMEQTPQLLASPDLLKKGGGRLLERGSP
ncbi:MAG: ankyrin repeat domain-containing protein [Nitrospirota bacterium]